MRLTAEITGLYVGIVATLVPGKPPSAIAKRPASGPLLLTPTGFATDEQADLAVHGGPEKAVHHYAADHYPTWRDELGSKAAYLHPGGFGENVSTLGLTEDLLCVGDVLTMGTATVQVSQGRQPCWKLNAHTGLPRMAMLFQRTARTGWYYRVLVRARSRSATGSLWSSDPTQAGPWPASPAPDSARRLRLTRRRRSPSCPPWPQAGRQHSVARLIPEPSRTRRHGWTGLDR